ncbi:MAG: hypothetical protein HY868_07190 [Chloroflexi bacterium]|nr:hypothetical protein [Chloroflexota bacterium]
MRVNPFFMPIILIMAMQGTVFTAQAMGQWSTSGKTSVNLEKLTPADLKGWMTLQQVVDGLQISKEQVYAAGNIPADTPLTTPLKDLEKLVPGFETSVLRDALTAQRGTTTAPAATTSAPAQAATPAATPAATATHTAGTGTGTGPTPMPAGQILPASQIKGSMTLRSVSEQTGVPLAKILEGLKLSADTNPEIALRDLVSQGKISEVTDAQKVVEALQGK